MSNPNRNISLTIETWEIMNHLQYTSTQFDVVLQDDIRAMIEEDPGSDSDDEASSRSLWSLCSTILTHEKQGLERQYGLAQEVKDKLLSQRSRRGLSFQGKSAVIKLSDKQRAAIHKALSERYLASGELMEESGY